MIDISFFKDKKVLITGHTGFKGSWMCEALLLIGAKVYGYSLPVGTSYISGNTDSSQNLYSLLGLNDRVTSCYGDIRNLEKLKGFMEEVQPEIVIHMAAQPIVRVAYAEPVYTYDVNVMGTVNILECVRCVKSVKSFVNVTTDKVYLNKEWEWGYRENEELNGYDPYSNSKSCSELVTDSYRKSFFMDESSCAISTCRAGNVIGGGDFAKDRIIPDCVRALEKKEDVVVRNQYSVRPYQHVLEPVFAYLLVAQMQYDNKKYAGCYNVGPNEDDCWTTGDLVNLFCELSNLKWINKSDEGPHEAGYLKLDCSKLKSTFLWRPKWDLVSAMNKIVEWNEVYISNGGSMLCEKCEDLVQCTDSQIRDYMS